MSQPSKRKKWLFNGLRIVVCVGALAFVLSTITLDDSVRLIDGEVLSGSIVQDRNGGLMIDLPDGRSREVTAGDIASNDEIRLADGTKQTGTIVGENAQSIELIDGSGQRQVIELSLVARDRQGAVRIERGPRAVTYGLKSVLKRAKPWLFVLAILVFVPGTFLQAKRFQWMLRTQDIRLSFWESLKLCYVGNFLNFVFAIGATAGDAYKMYSIAKHIERRTEAVIIVILDRLVGLIGLVILVLGLALITPKLADFRLYTLGFLVIGAVGAFVYLSPPIRRLIPAGWIQRLPKLEHLRRVDCMAQNCADHKSLTIGATLATMLLQVFCIGASVVVSVSLGFFEAFDLGQVFEFYAYFGAGWLIATIPISVQGMGTVEAAYLQLFQPYGSAAAIVCLAFAARILQVAASLPGAVILLVGAHHLPTAEEIENLESESDSEETAPSLDPTTVG